MKRSKRVKIPDIADALSREFNFSKEDLESIIYSAIRYVMTELQNGKIVDFEFFELYLSAIRDGDDINFKLHVKNKTLFDIISKSDKRMIYYRCRSLPVVNQLLSMVKKKYSKDDIIKVQDIRDILDRRAPKFIKESSAFDRIINDCVFRLRYQGYRVID